MKREELLELFCRKLELEYMHFKGEMLAQKPYEIFGSAYQIDCTINIYELMLEISRELEEETLKRLLTFPHLLDFLYDVWMQEEDSYTNELWRFLEETMKQIERAEKELSDGKEAQAA